MQQPVRPVLSRRALIVGGALPLLAGCSSNRIGPLATATVPVSTTPRPTIASSPTIPPPTATAPRPGSSAPALHKVPVPPGNLTALPGIGNLIAWTLDDGTDPAVVASYARFAQRSGTRLTFFVNGSYPAWTQHAALLRPLVTSGQLQLGNHTWSHQDLTAVSDAQIRAELQRNHDFLTATYGVDARPYYRPPYGYHNRRVADVAASVGYTVPTLWYGSLGDSGVLTPQQILDLARTWFLPQHIVLGHLNHPAVTEILDRLRALLDERGLRTVTLNDVFRTPGHP